MSATEPEPDPYRLLLDEVGAFVYTTDIAGNYTYANHLVLALLGNPPLQAIIGKAFTDFVDIGEAGDTLRETDRRVLREGETIAREETNHIHATGETRTYWSIKKPLRDKEGAIVGMLGISHDITELHALKEELQKQTRTDSLTGIANRRSFFERAEHEFARSRRHGTPLSVLAIDIDHFKRINDDYGHPAGDIALREFAARCQHMLREEDLCARTGGEEFCILLPDTGIDAAHAIAERIRTDVLEHDIHAEHQQLRATASFGVTCIDVADPNFGAVFSRADRALYSAKQGGRNRSCVLLATNPAT